MNGQIVLCKGVNDGEELDTAIRELTKYIPVHGERVRGAGGTVQVPGGTLSAGALYAGGCRRRSSIMIESWQKKIYEKYGIHFIHASDEWYILAGQDRCRRKSGMTAIFSWKTAWA